MVRIDKDYLIDMDSYNYIAKFDRHKTVVSKDGKESDSTDVIGYYSTFPGALEGIYEDKIKRALSGDSMSLEQAIETVKGIKTEMHDMFDTLNTKGGLVNG